VIFVPLVIAMYAAGVISGITGFGVGVVGSISLAVIIGPKSAVILLSILSSFTSGTQVLKFRGDAAVVKRLVWLLVAAFMGAVIGSFLLIWLSYTVLAIVLGVFTLTYVVTSVIGFRPSISPQAESVLSPTVGLIAGVVNSTVGSSGPVLGPYLLALGLSPSAFIICISVAFLDMGVVRLVTLAALQQYTAPILLGGLGLLVPTFGGQLTGFWLQNRITKHIFERLVLVMLATSVESVRTPSTTTVAEMPVAVKRQVTST